MPAVGIGQREEKAIRTHKEEEEVRNAEQLLLVGRRTVAVKADRRPRAPDINDGGRPDRDASKRTYPTQHHQSCRALGRHARTVAAQGEA